MADNDYKLDDLMVTVEDADDDLGRKEPWLSPAGAYFDRLCAARLRKGT